MKYLRRVVAIGALCASLLGLGVVTATQATAIESSPSVAVIQGGDAQSAAMMYEMYYEDYFFTEGNCEARGNAIINPGSPGHIPGAIAYTCILHAGDAKWSMYILWA